MSNDKQVTLTIGELDKFLFEEVITIIKPLFPDDHRAGLKAGMAIVDGVMEKFGEVVKKAQKSEAAKKAVAARWAPTMNPGAEPTPAAFETPAGDPAESPTAAKRRRRTKAEMEAARAGAPVLQPKMNPNPEEVAAMAPTLADIPPPPPPFASTPPVTLAGFAPVEATAAPTDEAPIPSFGG